MTPRQPVPEPGDASTSANHRTVGSYERIARDYADDTAPGPDGTSDVGGAAALRRLVAAVPAGGTALEVGSGPGWDADFVEANGVTVRRTDITQAFIDLQAARGKVVDRLDVTTDDLGGPYDVVFAHAVLLHIDRTELPSVLTRLRDAVRPGGLLAMSLKEGDGEEWSSHKLELPRHFTYWREQPLRSVLEGVGWTPVVCEHVGPPDRPWLRTLSRRG